MKNKLGILFNFLIFIILLSCVPSSSIKHSEVIFPKKEISVDEGLFIFQNLKLIPDVGKTYKLKGDVVNNTSKNWNEVTFMVNFYDQTGNKIKPSINHDIKLLVFKSREVKPLGYGYGENIFIDPKIAISRVDISLKDGEYPAQYIFKMIKPIANDDLIFKDNALNLEFNISNKQIKLILKNNTEKAAKIDWNQVSYVDVLGQSHKVMHSNIKYIDRDRVQAPTIVPPKSNIDDIIFPIDYVFYESGKYGGWREKALFPQAPDAKLYHNKDFSIYMPVEIDKTIKEYFFTFHIDKILF